MGNTDAIHEPAFAASAMASAVPGRLSVAAIVLLFALQFVDGIDQVALVMIAPSVRAELGLTVEELGASFTAGFIGTALGAIVFGTLADRIDRKAILCFAALSFAAGSLATIWVRSGTELFVIRLLTGLALGGLFPVVSAFVLEVAPTHLRATATSLIAVATTVGVTACGPLVAVLQPAFGWRSIFIFGSVAPAILTVLIIFLLPALAPRRQSIGGDTAREARRSPLFSSLTAFIERDHQRLTLCLWLGYICTAMPVFFILSWLPTLAHEAKMAPTTIALASSAYTLAGITFAVVFGRAIDKFGFRVLIATTGCGALAVLALGQSFGSGPVLLVTSALAGALLVSSSNLIGPAAGTLYQDTLRARGVGWAVAFMRLGAAIAPALGGLLIARDLPTGVLFAVFAVFPIVSAFAFYQLRNIKPAP